MRLRGKIAIYRFGLLFLEEISVKLILYFFAPARNHFLLILRLYNCDNDFRRKEDEGPMMSDETLVTKVLDGDSKALDELLERYYPKILKYCLWHLSSKEEAEDATQEVMIRRTSKSSTVLIVDSLLYSIHSICRFPSRIVLFPSRKLFLLLCIE